MKCPEKICYFEQKSLEKTTVISLKSGKNYHYKLKVWNFQEDQPVAALYLSGSLFQFLEQLFYDFLEHLFKWNCLEQLIFVRNLTKMMRSL